MFVTFMAKRKLINQLSSELRVAATLKHVDLRPQLYSKGDTIGNAH